MKKIIFALAVFLLIGGCATTKANPDEVSLSTAIRMAASRMELRLNEGTKVALINFTSPSQAFSDYVLDELSAVLVNNGQLVVVDRANLDKIRQELGFNVSGEVSDASMQEIGKILGAQALLTGSLTNIADLRRVMFKVIMTESAAVAVQHPADIINDKRVQALLAQGGGSKGLRYSGQSNARGNTANATTQTPTPAQATPPAPPAPPPLTPKTYKIGDTGPAGGLVFYDKGNNIGGWRYMEAAPADNSGQISFANNRAGLPYEYTNLLPSERIYSVGRGKENTDVVMDWLNKEQGGGFGWAIRICDDLVINGFDDWFLPSRDELNYMYGNLHLKGLGNFKLNNYWTSSVYIETWWRTQMINFTNGKTAEYGSNFEGYNTDKAYVRAARRF